MTVTSELEAKAYVRELCSETAFGKVEAFVERLLEASERQNLVSRSTLGVVWQRHVADSAQLLEHVSRETLPLLDVGSGAGFPGIILAILRPNLPVELIESRKLRIEWLGEIIYRQSLRNCRVHAADVREVGSFAAQTITARAFASLPRILNLSARFSTSTTDWVLPKGRSARQEVTNLPATLRRKFHVEQSVTDPESGIIVGKGRMEPFK